MPKKDHLLAIKIARIAYISILPLLKEIKSSIALTLHEGKNSIDRTDHFVIQVGGGMTGFL
jgi:hypothetical protein